jgi:DNA-directed RNA polymerase specialized sigma24 family protein
MPIRVSSKTDEETLVIIKKLRSYREKVAAHQACKELYENLFPSCIQQFSDMPPHRTEVYESERWADRRWSQKDRMNKSLEEMHEEYQKIEQMIEILNGYHKVVIMRRYIFNESYEQISAKIHCHRNAAKNWHDRAISILVEKCVHI